MTFWLLSLWLYRSPQRYDTRREYYALRIKIKYLLQLNINVAHKNVSLNKSYGNSIINQTVHMLEFKTILQLISPSLSRTPLIGAHFIAEGRIIRRMHPQLTIPADSRHSYCSDGFAAETDGRVQWKSSVRWMGGGSIGERPIILPPPAIDHMRVSRWPHPLSMIAATASQSIPLIRKSFISQQTCSSFARIVAFISASDQCATLLQLFVNSPLQSPVHLSSLREVAPRGL